MTTSLVSIAAREHGLVGARIRRRSLALQVGVVAVWSAGSIALTLTLLALSGSRSQISGIVFAMISFTALGPLASWVGRVIKQRASAG